MNDNSNILSFDYDEASNEQNRWRYIVCGVNAKTNKAYLANLMKENRVEINFNSNNNLQNSGDSYLKISENSNKNF